MSGESYRTPPTERIEYRVVGGTDTKSLSNVLTELAAEGFRVVPGGAASGGETRGVCFLLERRITQ